MRYRVRPDAPSLLADAIALGGHTRKSLGRELGMSDNTIARYVEPGQTVGVTPATALKLANYASAVLGRNVTVLDLIEVVDEAKAAA